MFEDERIASSTSRHVKCVAEREQRKMRHHFDMHDVCICTLARAV